MHILILRCLDCNEVLVITPFDDEPDYEYDSKNDNVIVIKRNEGSLARQKHANHRTEKLRIVEGTFVSKVAEGQPIREVYFEATNGIESFVIRRYRKNINEPMQYELINGWIHIKDFEIVNHNGVVCWGS